MLDITGRNVNEIYPEALWKMKVYGTERHSRNGLVRRIPGPVATTYNRPTERMLMDVRRDANPFFHIFEGVWMLAGRNDVHWVGAFNSNIHTYSDDGIVLKGAYGHRWRNHFGYDQLAWVVQHLRNDPTSRRAVLQMFDPVTDQGWSKGGSKDVPCNTAAYFELENNRLNMCVTCRSNDMIWGAYGANVVHMSMLQEFIANCLGVDVGVYTQFSFNFHMYERHFSLLEGIEVPALYPQDVVDSHVGIVRFGKETDDTRQLMDWIVEPDVKQYSNPFIVTVLAPMLRAWRYYKSMVQPGALKACGEIKDLEIKAACTEWMKRRNWNKGH